MASLFSQYESGLQLTAGALTGSVLGTSGLNPIVDRLNSISTAASLVTGSLVSGTSLVISGTGVISGTIAKFYGTSTSSTSVPGIIEIATSAETQTGTDTTRAVSPDGAFDVIPPVGGVVAWIKSMVGVPQTLPAGWVECNGATISDGESPMNGQAVPDLNGGEFLRGQTTSGGTGGSDTMAHTHTTNVTVNNHTSLTISNHSSHSHNLASTGYAKIGAADGNFQHWVHATESSFTATRALSAGAAGVISEAFTEACDLGGATSSKSISAHSFSQNISVHSVGNPASDGASNTENRPKYYNVVWIMRIK